MSLWDEVDAQLKQRRQRAQRQAEEDAESAKDELKNLVERGGLADLIGEFPLVCSTTIGAAYELGRDFYVIPHTDARGKRGLAVLYYPDRGPKGLRPVKTQEHIRDAIVQLTDVGDRR